MYSRSFYPSEVSTPPENYNGTAFSEPAPIYEASVPEPEPPEEATVSTVSENISENRQKSEPTGLFSLPFLSGLFGGSEHKGSLGGLFSSIGIEEILIIAVAAFLFFSKDGDTECAILLLLLLFVK